MAGVREGRCDSARKRESDKRKERWKEETEGVESRGEELRKPGPDPLRGCN